MRVEITPSDVDMCPKCGSVNIGCAKTENMGEGRRRVKKCADCGNRYKTIEITEVEYEKLVDLIITDNKLASRLFREGILNVSTS